MTKPAKQLTRLAVTLLFLALSAQACSGKAPAETLITAPTAEAPAIAASSAPTLQPTATTVLPTATPTPQPTPCLQPLQPDLAKYWSAGLLGCPYTPGESTISTAYVPFERGQMLWRGDMDLIYVLTTDGRWRSFPNEWREGDPTFSCGEENPMITPIRGFGRVWCDHPDVREVLGNAAAEEIGDGASAVQDFGNGTILMAPFGGIFVFVNEDSTWRRVDD